MKDRSDSVTYQTGIVLTEVVDIIQELFTVLEKGGATLSARQYAMGRVEECIMKLYHLKIYLKQDG